MFDNFDKFAKENYEKAKQEVKLKEEKKLKENQNDGRKETIDIDKCYASPRDHFEKMLKMIGETQSTIDNLFNVYSFGVDRLVDLRQVFWVYLITGGPEYIFKLDRLFRLMDLNNSGDLDKVEFNKLI